MEIEWKLNTGGGDRLSTLAKIQMPSNIRLRDKFNAALYQQYDDGLWRTAFAPAIREHFDVPKTPLHTELGARRRIRKYLELWAIAGYPTESK
jgi:hypothetical protein